MYRTLSESHVAETARRLAERIGASFPESGLSKVAREVAQIAGETGGRVQELRKPAWLLRIGGIVAIALAFAAAVFWPMTVDVRPDLGGYSDFLQAIEAAVNNIIFIAVAVYFMVTLEMRPKRRAALAAMHELRSLAHVIDMHQLTKDPDFSSWPDGAEDGGVKPRTRVELARYLDYCSEALSLVSKLAALYLQHLNDPVVLAAVDEVQQLTDGLSAKIWRKIMILDRAAPMPRQVP